MNSDSRNTVIENTTSEQEEIEEIIRSILKPQNFTLFDLLQQTSKHSGLRKEPELIKCLFHQHLDLVAELIEWVTMPETIAKAKKCKQKYSAYPYLSKEFMKDNWAFYEYLYVAAVKEQLPLAAFFRFLKQENYEPSTAATALGYISQILVPFAKYDFSTSIILQQEKSNSQRLSSHQSQSIMKILPESLTNHLLLHSHQKAVFDFLATSILVTIEDPQDFMTANGLLLRLLTQCEIDDFLGTITNPAILVDEDEFLFARKMISLLSMLSTMLHELYENIDPEVMPSVRIKTIINGFINSNLFPYTASELQKSRRCTQSKSSVLSKQKSFDAEKGRRFSQPQENLSASQPLGKSRKSSIRGKNQFEAYEIDDEEAIESMLKILNLAIEIYMKIPKRLSSFPEANYAKQEEFPASLLRKPLKDKSEQELYAEMVLSYRLQIQHILECMPAINRLVYENSWPSRSSAFSSGQDIRHITLAKYNYFKLLYTCLVVIQQRDPKSVEERQQQTQEFIIKNSDRSSLAKTKSEGSPETSMKIKKTNSLVVSELSLNVEALSIVEVVKKYLSENRWNNLAHRVLEKIIHVFIMTKYEYMKKDIQKDSNLKLSNSFMAYLIQNFNQRDYIYLETLRFTSQGNLHSLYNIAKFLAYTLNSTNQLAILLNEFEPWKKFLMVDLKRYEEKTFPKITLPSHEEMNSMERKSAESYDAMKVDEVDTICNLIQNISASKKWPKKKSISKSGIFRRSFGESSNLYEYMYKSEYMHKSSGNENQKMEWSSKASGMWNSCHKKMSSSIEQEKHVAGQSEEMNPRREGRRKMTKSGVFETSSKEYDSQEYEEGAKPSHKYSSDIYTKK